jgi:hypothetical protein
MFRSLYLVFVQADLPASAELTLALTLTPPPAYFAVHPCVRSQGGVSLSLLRCLPPPGIASLCDYSGVRLPQPPIRGFYQMTVRIQLECVGGLTAGAGQEKGADTVQLLVQLKLSDALPNNFEFCEALIPFARRCAPSRPSTAGRRG